MQTHLVSVHLFSWLSTLQFCVCVDLAWCKLTKRHCLPFHCSLCLWAWWFPLLHMFVFVYWTVRWESQCQVCKRNVFLHCRKSTAICRVQPFSTQEVRMGREFDVWHSVFCLADVDLLMFKSNATCLLTWFILVWFILINWVSCSWMYQFCHVAMLIWDHEGKFCIIIECWRNNLSLGLKRIIYTRWFSKVNLVQLWLLYRSSIEIGDTLCQCYDAFLTRSTT